jgi:5'-deoxynucleotidase YfbR-like HD superfamily hydrolase
MKDKHPSQSELSPAELKLIDRLREHPELMERFQHILEISSSAEGTVKKADEIEALLIEELRRLGNVTMEGWASGAEKSLTEQLKQRDPSATVRKKKR